MDHIILGHLDLWATHNTPDKLAEAILRFEEARHKICRQQLSADAAEKFCWKKVFTKLLHYYEEVMV